MIGCQYSSRQKVHQPIFSSSASSSSDLSSLFSFLANNVASFALVAAKAANAALLLLALVVWDGRAGRAEEEGSRRDERAGIQIAMEFGLGFRASSVLGSSKFLPLYSVVSGLPYGTNARLMKANSAHACDALYGIVASLPFDNCSLTTFHICHQQS